MEIPADNLLKNELVFIVGLHRSGTTLIEDVLSQHADVSSLENTGVPMNEGQHVQSVYPSGKHFGGPGKFGFKKKAHLTEDSPLCTLENRKKLLAEWGKFWDFDKKVLLEKSPPHIIRTRFLQGLFPEAKFIVVTRHPLAVALATQKWSRTTIYSLVKHWVKCHQVLADDLEHVPNKMWMSYENFVANPEDELARICNFVGLDKIDIDKGVIKESNNKYFKKWKTGLYHKFLKHKFEKDISVFGYSFQELSSAK